MPKAFASRVLAQLGPIVPRSHFRLPDNPLRRPVLRDLGGFGGSRCRHRLPVPRAVLVTCSCTCFIEARGSARPHPFTPCPKLVCSPELPKPASSKSLGEGRGGQPCPHLWQAALGPALALQEALPAWPRRCRPTAEHRRGVLATQTLLRNPPRQPGLAPVPSLQWPRPHGLAERLFPVHRKGKEARHQPPPGFASLHHERGRRGSRWLYFSPASEPRRDAPSPNRKRGGRERVHGWENALSLVANLSRVTAR